MILNIGLKHRLARTLILSSVLVATSPVSAQDSKCIGHKSSDLLISYLHGLDSVSAGLQEQQNRKILEDLAESLKIRIAILRSNDRCKGKLCWPHDPKKKHLATFNKVKQASQTCWTKATKTWGLLGFSNGGYFASKVGQYCYKGGPSWIMASGSAGSDRTITKSPASLCPPIRLIIGNKDITRTKAEAYANFLKKAGYDASLEIFPGRHELHMESLKKVISQLRLKGKRTQ